MPYQQHLLAEAHARLERLRVLVSGSQSPEGNLLLSNFERAYELIRRTLGNGNFDRRSSRISSEAPQEPEGDTAQDDLVALRLIAREEERALRKGADTETGLLRAEIEALAEGCSELAKRAVRMEAALNAAKDRQIGS